MEMEKILDIISKAVDAVDSVVKAEESVKAEKLEAERTARDIIEGYFKDLNEKRRKISADSDELREKLTGLDAKAEALTSSLIAARVTGDNAELQELQAEINKIEIDKAAIETELRLLSNAAMPDNSEVYDAAIEADAEVQKIFIAAEEFYTMLVNVAEDQIRIWEALKSASINRKRFPHDVGYRRGWSTGESRFQKMIDHHEGKSDALQGSDVQPVKMEFAGQNMQTAAYTFGKQ